MFVIALALPVHAQSSTDEVANVNKQEVDPVAPISADKLPQPRESLNPVAQQQTPPTHSVFGDRHDWLRGAGIAESDWGYVSKVLGQESGWRVDAVNSIGCIGLGQACPSGNKSEMLQRCPDWQTNGACQMKVWNDYALRRYGSWAYAAEWKFCTSVCYNTHTGASVNKKGEPWW